MSDATSEKRRFDPRRTEHWLLLGAIALVALGLMLLFDSRRLPDGWRDRAIGTPQTIQAPLSFVLVLAGIAAGLGARWLGKRRERRT